MKKLLLFITAITVNATPTFADLGIMDTPSEIAAKNGDLGLFLQAGKVMVQVDNFLYSCAEGHSFPAALPVQYIRNDRLRAAVGSGTNP